MAIGRMGGEGCEMRGCGLWGLDCREMIRECDKSVIVEISPDWSWVISGVILENQHRIVRPSF